MSGNDRKTLPYVRVWSRDYRRCPEVVERPSRRFGRPSWMYLSGREPPECPEGVGRPSRMSWSGWEVLTNIPEGSGGHPECP